MEAFMKSIVQVGIFMICAQVLIHFRPNGSYEKYMKMLVSIMILIQVAFPIAGLLTGGKSNLEERAAWFETRIQESMKAAQEAAEESDRLLEQMTLEQLKEQISEGAAAEREIENQEEQNVLQEMKGQESTDDQGNLSQIERIDTQVEKIEINIGSQ